MKIKEIYITPTTMRDIYGIDGIMADGEYHEYPKDKISSINICYYDQTLEFYDKDEKEVFKMVDVDGGGFENILNPFIKAMKNIKNGDELL